jgi:cell division protease FtsH
MEAQSERLFSETKQVLAQYTALTEHLTGRLMQSGEMTLSETLGEIRRFEFLAAPALLPAGQATGQLMTA